MSSYAGFSAAGGPAAVKGHSDFTFYLLTFKNRTFLTEA
jgi:hypothetical protein